MNAFVGKWSAVGMPDRVLFLKANGTGHFSVAGERLPFIRWHVTESGELMWQFFLDPSHTEVASREHEAKLSAPANGSQLRFVHSPFPFGIRHFERAAEG